MASNTSDWFSRNLHLRALYVRRLLVPSNDKGQSLNVLHKRAMLHTVFTVDGDQRRLLTAKRQDYGPGVEVSWPRDGILFWINVFRLVAAPLPD